MGGTYYNDNDPFVCDWLENLIREKLFPDGVVDRRPIQEVQASDVRGFTQCHFFAGIGGWPYALQLAKWGDRPVWTGSCPCQPFSAAGKQKAHYDERHLWPAWFRLIRECRPERIFGEQVASGVGLGWLDVVSTDLEAEAYTVGAVVLGAHSVGAPHIRQRLWFVADASSGRRQQECQSASAHEGTHGRREDSDYIASGDGPNGELADAESGHGRLSVQLGRPQQESIEPRRGGEVGGGSWQCKCARCRQLADADGGNPGAEGIQRGGEHGQRPKNGGAGFWDGWAWLPCGDGKARPIPVEPALFPLATGIPNRLGTLRGAGNSINPWTAAAFVKASMEAASS